jgi:Flp pilus assembly protein TadB
MYEREFEILNKRFEEYFKVRLALKPFSSFWRSLIGTESSFIKDIPETMSRLQKIDRQIEKEIDQDIANNQITIDAVTSYATTLRSLSGQTQTRVNFIALYLGILAFALSVLTFGSSKSIDLFITSFVFLLLITRLTTESHRRFVLSACATSFEQILKEKGVPNPVAQGSPSDRRHCKENIANFN